MNPVRNFTPPRVRGIASAYPVTRKMLHDRTCEVARRAGRTAPYVTQADYEQAKRDLTGDPHAVISDTTIDDSLLIATSAQRQEVADHPAPTSAANTRPVSDPPHPHGFFSSYSHSLAASA